MPTRPLHPCPGCRRNLVAHGRCVDCRKVEQRQRDERRGSSAKRGYGHAHRRRRAGVLARDPLCVCCLAQGIVEPSSVADHIVPISAGGSAEDMDNQQGLCDGQTGRGCHDRKRAAEARGRQLIVRDGVGFVDVGQLGTWGVCQIATALAARPIAQPTSRVSGTREGVQVSGQEVA